MGIFWERFPVFFQFHMATYGGKKYIHIGENDVKQNLEHCHINQNECE